MYVTRMATCTIAVLGNFVAQRVGPEMSNLAKKIHRRFRVAVLKLSIRGAHAAKRLNPAAAADRGSLALAVSYFEQRSFPALHETSAAAVVPLLMRENADAHHASRVNGAAPVPPAAP